MAKALQLGGQRFGLLIAMEVVGRTKATKAQWACLCDCGNTTMVVASHLRNGHTQSCGCRQLAVVTKHGRSRTDIYNIWAGLIYRCTSPTSAHWEDWGGRGIRVCDRWTGEGGFERFAEDVGPRPSRKYSIDRINNDGDYEPNNVHWATKREQANNFRRNHLVTFDGLTLSISAWARRVGLNTQTLTARLTRLGWSIERSLTIAPILKRRHPDRREVKNYRQTKPWKAIKRRIHERDGWACVICGHGQRERLQCHHIIPIECGGNHAESNLATVCRSCHSKQEMLYGTPEYFWA